MSLSTPDRSTLEAGRHHHPQHQFRGRCQGLLWSADGQDVPALAVLLDVSQTTGYSWFNRWERGGLAGLVNAQGPGRRAIRQAADGKQVKAAVRANCQQLQDLTAALRQELAKAFSP